MKFRTLLLTIVLSAGLFSQTNEGLISYLMPGPWAFCSIDFSPVLCGVWKAEGEPVNYELFLSTIDPRAVGYSYSVTATLSNNVTVTRSGIVPRTDLAGSGSATLVILSFGGKIYQSQILVHKIGIIP